MLCQMFHHILHNLFFVAQDLLLVSHLQDVILNTGDTSTMILFICMMVTLGLAAFRNGLIWDAYQCLLNACFDCVYELLAQGVSLGWFFKKILEQKKDQKMLASAVPPAPQS